MPSNYTDYDPVQPLSPEQATALSEIKKIIEARIIYNKNLLEFMLNKKNEEETNVILKALDPAINANFLPLLKQRFIQNTAHDLQHYNKRYIEHIKTCKTISAFDDLYFQFFMESESQKHNETDSRKQTENSLKDQKISTEKREQLLKNAQALCQEKDVFEVKYYQEICDLLEKHISLRSREFKQHHTFIPSISPEDGPGMSIAHEDSLEQLFSDIKALNKKLVTKFNAQWIDTDFNEIDTKHFLLQQPKLIERYKKTLPRHALESFDSFNGYRVMRQYFDLCMDFLSKGNKLLHPEKKPRKKQTLSKKTITTETAIPPSLIDSNAKITTEPSIEPVVEEKECVAMLTEVAPPVAVPVTQPSELQAKVSQCVLAFPIPVLEQKNDTSMLLMEFPKIHPILQFIAGLDATESATLLSWTQKAPHMQVEINELKRTIKNLNGTIDTSGGGSHHRIIFKNSLAFVDAFEQNSTTGTESTTKGTLVKQHGKGKSSRFLPSYAIKTFVQTLQKMGVTENILRIYTHTHSSCRTFKNPQDKMVLLTNAQSALVRDQSKMLLLLGIHKSKKNQKGDYPALRKLNPVRSGGKEATQRLMKTVFSFCFQP